MSLGDIQPGQVLYTMFSTFPAGVPTTWTGTPTVAVLKDADATPETTGVTLTVDYNSVTGQHLIKVDTSADGTFYAAGNSFRIVATGGTVGGNNMAGWVIDDFSILDRSALTPVTAGNQAAVDSSGRVILQPTQNGVSFTGGLVISNSGGSGLVVSGSGGSHGILSTGGSTGYGMKLVGGSTSGSGLVVVGSAGNSHGILATGFGSGHGFSASGGGTGSGMNLVGGSTSGHGLAASAATLGSGLYLIGAGSSNYDIKLAGDGIIEGALSGSVGSVTGAVGSVTGAVGSVTGSVGSISGITFPTHFSTLAIDGSGYVTFNNSLSSLATASALSGLITTVGTAGAGLTAVAGITWNALTASYTASGSFGAALGSGSSGPTAAQIATAVWQDATSGDFTVSGSIGKSLFTSGAAPGATSGIALVGSTMGLTSTAITAIDTELSANHGSGEWGSSTGSGAYTVTVTVTDTSSAAVAGANVRLTNGVTSLVAGTNNSGVSTFAVDAAVWAIAITKSGYTFTPTTITVSASANFAETITPVVIPSPPSGSPVCNVYGFFETLTGATAIPIPVFGTPNPIPITFQLSVASGTSGSILVIQTVVGQILNGVLSQPGTTNNFLPLVRNDSITPANTTYLVSCPAIGLSNTPITLAAGTYDLATVVPP